MRLLTAAFVLTLAVAAGAAVLASWPVVGDAPWEEAAEEQQCGTLRERRQAASHFRLPPNRVSCTDVERLRRVYELRCEAALELRNEAHGQRGSLAFRARELAEDEVRRYC